MVYQVTYGVGTAVAAKKEICQRRESIAQPYLGCENSLRYNGFVLS